MFLKNTSHRLILAVLPALFSIGCGQATDTRPADSPSSVWVAEKDGHHIYLAGTIHLLRKEDYPLPSVFEQAYRDSKRLVFELPPGEENQSAAVKMREMGTYPPGETLSKNISEETLEKVKTWSAKNSLPMAALDQLRPWFLALTIAAVEYQALGAESLRGVDSYFEKKAREDAKPGEGLETVEFQLSMFASLEPKLQEELLRQTFTEAETLSKDFNALATAWRTGDAEKLQEFMFRDAEKYPELMEKFLIKRNQSWIEPLMRLLEKGDPAMVLVGAGHLGGRKGVLELLKEKGCTIRQMGAAN